MPDALETGNLNQNTDKVLTVGRPDYIREIYQQGMQQLPKGIPYAKKNIDFPGSLSHLLVHAVFYLSFGFSKLQSRLRGIKQDLFSGYGKSIIAEGCMEKFL